MRGRRKTPQGTINMLIKRCFNRGLLFLLVKRSPVSQNKLSAVGGRLALVWKPLDQVCTSLGGAVDRDGPEPPRGPQRGWGRRSSHPEPRSRRPTAPGGDAGDASGRSAPACSPGGNNAARYVRLHLSSSRRWGPDCLQVMGDGA